LITPPARSDLVEIRAYLRRERRSAWTVVRRRLELAFRMVGEAPGIGHLRRDLTARPLRFWPVYSYLVVYDPATEPVRIVRIVHGARDVPLLFVDQR
jgi:toxin ParE1/3/4